MIQCECGACVKSIYYHRRSKKHKLYLQTGVKYKTKNRVDTNKKYYEKNVKPIRMYNSSIQWVQTLFI